MLRITPGDKTADRETRGDGSHVKAENARGDVKLARRNQRNTGEENVKGAG